MATMKSGTDKYGDLYWCIKTDLSTSGEIYVMADEAHILPDGSLSMISTMAGSGPRINLAIASGKWSAVYAASLLDGAAVAVERWEGEVSR